MTAANRKVLESAPGDIEGLLPWYAAGTLGARDVRQVEAALARDPELSKQYAVIQEEFAETISFNESLGAPSARAMHKLFAAIAAEPAREPARLQLSARIVRFFANLSPRTLAAASAIGALALLLQAGVIGAMWARHDAGNVTFQTAALRMPNAPLTRGLAAADAGPLVIVRFAPDARVADIDAFLDAYRASVVSASVGGLFQLRFGGKPMSAQEFASLISRVQSEKIVSLAVPAK